MRQVTIKALQEEMQTLANQVGAERFARAKALYLDKVMVTDEDGSPVDPEEIEVVLTPKMAEEEEDKEEEKAAEIESEEDKDEEEKYMPKSNRNGRKKALSAISKSAPSVIRPKMWTRLKNFKDDENGEAIVKAEKFGRWLLAQNGHRKSLAWCDAKGIEVKAHTEGVNSQGGFLVPEEFEEDLISLREEYGVFRRNSRVRPMTSDTLRVPRRSATLTPHFVGEATAGTESTQTFESVLLVAKKAMVLTTVSNELNEDAFVNLADDVAGEIAYALAKKEDECGFLGDGTSTFGGIVGLANAMGSAGIKATAEMSADTLAQAQAQTTIGYLTSVMAALPAYADTPNCKWYMHKSVYHSLVQNRALEAGGTTQAMMLGEKVVPSLFGYPVEFAQVLPNLGTLTDTLRIGYFGDLTLATSFGDRRQTEIQISDSALNAFEQDELAIRGTERFDINCHDTGDSSDAGPIIAMNLLNDS
jgi:HK97 family phage major capsid protein